MGIRLFALLLPLLLLLAACARSDKEAGAQAVSQDVYELHLEQAATAEGKLVLKKPARIELPIASGATAQEVSLALRQELSLLGYEVTCLVDRGDEGFALLLPVPIELSGEESDLGGIGGRAGLIVQRSEVIQSIAREYLRLLSANDDEGLRQVVTSSFFPKASSELGASLTRVAVGKPLVGCLTTSVVIELKLPGGVRQQRELRLVLEEMTWRIDGSQLLAAWTAQEVGQREQ